MFAEKTPLIVVLATILFLTLATTQFVRALPHAQAGLVMYERTCPSHTASRR